MTEKNYSLDAFNGFMESVAKKGILNKNTAQSRKAAANKILGILDEADQADLRNVDLDQVFDRFQNLQGTAYTPDSLQVYKSRTNTALTDFLAWVENPSAFRPVSAQKSRANNVKKQVSRGSSPKSASKSTPRLAPSSTSSRADERPGQIVVPVPLREGITVEICNLPADLTEAEAARLASIIQAYAVVKEK